MSEEKKTNPEKMPNWEKKLKTPETLVGTQIWHKNPQKHILCSAKMAPQEVVQFLALQGVQFPYVYVYIYICAVKPARGPDLWLLES